MVAYCFVLLVKPQGIQISIRKSKQCWKSVFSHRFRFRYQRAQFTSLLAEKFQLNSKKKHTYLSAFINA